MEVLAVVGIGLVAAMLTLLLRQHRPEFAMLVSLAAGVVILLMVCRDLLPVVDQIRTMMQSVSMPQEYTAVLFKALGICFLTQVACDTCKDAGEGAIAAKVEMAGKVLVLAVSLPLFQQVLSIVYSLMV